MSSGGGDVERHYHRQLRRRGMVESHVSGSSGVGHLNTCAGGDGRRYINPLFLPLLSSSHGGLGEERELKDRGPIRMG